MRRARRLRRPALPAATCEPRSTRTRPRRRTRWRRAAAPRRRGRGSRRRHPYRGDPTPFHLDDLERPTLVLHAIADHGDAPESVEQEPGERLVRPIGHLEAGGLLHRTEVRSRTSGATRSTSLACTTPTTSSTSSPTTGKRE